MGFGSARASLADEFARSPGACPDTTIVPVSVSSPSLQTVTPPSSPPRSRRRHLLYYIWLVLKNLIGWTLILISGPVGVTFPGPGGIPLFVIGFGMITLPGKRALTGRVLRGALQSSPCLCRALRCNR